MAIKPVTYQGASNFKSNLYALEIKSRFIDQTKANGYYKGYGEELNAIVSGNVVTVRSGALLVQGRLNEIETGGEAVTVTIQNGYVGYILARIETYHPDDTENCTLVARTGVTLASIALTQDDTYQRTAESENKVYELPLYSFSMSGGAITNLVKLITAVEENTATRDIANEAKSIANGAASTAASAASTAASAASTANTANSTANTAKSTADTAKATADSAASTAASAVSTANTAKTSANTAKSTAESAASTANTAKTSASAAQTAAEKAQEAAEKAQEAAEHAQAQMYVHHISFKVKSSAGGAASPLYKIFCDIVTNTATPITTLYGIMALLEKIQQHSCTGYHYYEDTVYQTTIHAISYEPLTPDTHFRVDIRTYANGAWMHGENLVKYQEITDVTDHVT